MVAIVINKRFSFKYYLALLPFIFALIFLGYLRPKFDVILQVNKTIGDGTLSAYTAGNPNISQYFSGSIEYNENRKNIGILNCLYDIDGLTIELSGISQTEIESAEVRVFGVPIGRYSALELMANGHISEGINIVSEGTSLLFSFDDPSRTNTLTFEGIKFLPWFFWCIYFFFVFTATFFVSIIYKYIHDKYQFNNQWLVDISFTILTLLAGSYFNGSLAYLTYEYFFLNFILLFCISLIIGAVTWRLLGFIAGTFICLVFYIANYFVILYRIRPIMPSDLSAIETAKQVIDGYTLVPPPQMLIAIVCWAVFLVFYIHFCRNHTRCNNTSSISKIVLKRMFTGLSSILVLFIAVHNPIYSSLGTFKWDYRLLAEFNYQGMLLTFVQNYLSSRVKEPDSYSAESVNRYLKNMQAEDDDIFHGEQPQRIIMIMDEAFSDLRVSGLDSSIDVLPFIDSLEENTISGELYVSVLGGGTCNTEFEAITGNSMAFLPYGTYPYNEYINRNLFSIAQFLKNQSYSTNAFHPQSATNWSRSKVYPLLSIDKFYSISDYVDTSEICEKVSDLSNFEFVEKTIGDNSNSKDFTLNVTIQNHSGYGSWEGLDEAQGVDNIPTGDLQIYLSLIKQSDNAVKQIINHYKNSKIPTMIVFFGDHQPALSSDSATYVYGNNSNPLNQYKTKFFIWTNYETPSKKNVKISANYLPWLILKQGNFEMPPYIKMLGKVHEKYPVLCAQGVIDSDGNQYSSVNDILDDPLIREYQYVQYANMFDQIDDAWFHVN